MEVRWARLVAAALVVAAISCGGDLETHERSRPVPPDKPIILIVVDTLRADHLGLYGYRRPTSPVLDHWASEGRVYDNAFATAPWTLPSFGSLYTGRWPLIHRAGLSETNDDLDTIVPSAMTTVVPTVAEILSSRGFETMAVLNNPFLDPSFGTARGFDVFDYVPGNNRDIRRADAVVRRALELVDNKGGRPFFLVVHLFDPHLDYDAPAPFRGSFSDFYESQFTLPFSELRGVRENDYALSVNDRAFISAAYDEEVAFVDRELGKLRDGLAERGLLDKSLVILTSDHGEEFFEHGGFEHGHAMWQELLHVPFVIWGPDIVPGRDSGPVSLVDVAPTVFEWVGVTPPGRLDGISLWPNLATAETLSQRTLFAEGRLYGPARFTAVRWPHKILVDQGNELLAVFDLEHDYRERLNRLASLRDTGTLLQTALVDRRRAAAKTMRSRPAVSPELSGESLDRLRSLGYVR